MSIYYTLERVNEYPFSPNAQFLYGVGQSVEELQVFIERLLEFWQKSIVPDTTIRSFRIRRWTTDEADVPHGENLLFVGEWVFTESYVKASTNNIADLMHAIRANVTTRKWARL